jgi:hypothetical protein
LRLDNDAAVIAGFGLEPLKPAVIAIDPFAHSPDDLTKIVLANAYEAASSEKVLTIRIFGQTA